MASDNQPPKDSSAGAASRPPRWAKAFLKRITANHLREELLGDLDELFHKRSQRLGDRKARLWYVLDMLLLLHPRLWRRQVEPVHKARYAKTHYAQSEPRTPFFLSPSMIRSYLKIAIRHLLRQKGYSFIKVFGLSFGLTCCLLIALYVRYELSYDRFHAQADHIYRVVEDVTKSAGTVAQASTVGAVGPALVSEFPEVIGTVRFKGATMLMQHGEKRFQEDHIFFTDSTVFAMFSFPLLKGNPRTALAAPSSIVLSEAAAQRYFGTEDPLGKTLLIDKEYPFTVTGIVKNVPANSHLRFDMLLSLTTMNAGDPKWTEGWFWNAYTYVQLTPGYQGGSIESKLRSFVQRHTGDTQLKPEQRHVLSLQPLTDIHLHSNRTGEPGMPGSLANVYLFSAIAGLILLIACVNFVNLTTAQAAKRAKEVGLRKVVGGTRGQLASQFLAESVVLCLGAALLAIVFGYILLPWFCDLIGIPLTLAVPISPLSMTLAGGLVIGVGLLAGGYPAFLLSGFQPTRVLKGVWRGSSSGSWLREGLIVVQFVISIALMVGTGVVFSQLRYVQQQNLGYKKDQTLILYFGDDTQIQQQVESIKSELVRSSGVEGAAASSHIPGKEPSKKQVEVETSNGTKQATDMSLMAADYDFVPLYNLKLIAGRSFSPLHGSDSTHALLINETAARQLGFRKPEEAVDKPFRMGEQTGTVVGVVNDFHYVSLHKRIEPLAIRMRSKSLSYLSLRVRPSAMATTMQELESRWQTLAPHRPFDYFFLDAQFDQQYRSDQQFGAVFGVAALIAIILACLGLFSLVSLTVQQRTKEIGIRKVLGASVSSVVTLLSKDFVKLVLIAILIASPLAWYVMNRWLENFAYKMAISWLMFAGAGLLTVGIALLTVSFQSIKAALVNPVKSLRSE